MHARGTPEWDDGQYDAAMGQMILPNTTSLVTVEQQGDQHLYTLIFSDRLGTHRVYVPVASAPVLIEHYREKDYRDYPAAWDWREVLIYDAGEVTITIIYTDGAYMDAPEATVEVELVDLTPHLDTTWPA
jgi:hypothetical protein